MYGRPRGQNSFFCKNKVCLQAQDCLSGAELRALLNCCPAQNGRCSAVWFKSRIRLRRFCPLQAQQASLYQQVGNFFIALGPIFGGALFVYAAGILLALAMHEVLLAPFLLITGRRRDFISGGIS